ncbi:MAG: LPS assembly lipoprotein LptE [Rhodospirillales bacterium]|jgi:LPS-assembly lipoprotein|nr:LPS assembly lipoprotein LptE [Rhodospirillales bacterium]
MYGEAGKPAAQPTAAGTADHSPVSDLAAVGVARIPNRQGQILRNELSDRLNPGRISTPSRYTLKVSLREDARALAIDRQGLATRNNLTMTARYSVTDDASGRVIFTSGARAVVGYDVLAGQPTAYFSTVVARQDAESRALTQIANQMTARLSAFFDTHPGGIGADAPSAPAGAEVQPGFIEESDHSLDDLAPWTGGTQPMDGGMMGGAR